MHPSIAVAEQQAKLGVSAEESKAQRLKRQQARFRDRGGAFVPSNSNPLVDILLARTVSGESPSKARSKDALKQPLPSRQASPAVITETVAGSSRPKSQPSSRKRKAVEPEAAATSKPAPKRRGRPPKSKKKAPDPESETELPPPQTEHTSKGKGKKRATITATSTSNRNSKPESKAKAKANPANEVRSSDDDETLVEVPRKAKSNHKRIICPDDDDDMPVVRKRAKASSARTLKGINKDDITVAGSSQEKIRNGKSAKTIADIRLVTHDEDDIVALPSKRMKVACKTQAANEPEPALVSRTRKDVEDPRVTVKRKGKSGAELDLVVPVEEDANERPPERTSKLKKRKKEDSYDDRPRKAVKFTEAGPPHSLSEKLKENNQLERKHKNIVKSSVKEEPDVVRIKLAAKSHRRAKTPKGPPLEVLERIKANAARYLKCADNEPDELDCLS